MKIKEIYNAIPKKVKYIITIILLLILFYTGGYVTGICTSTKTPDNSALRHVNTITNTIEQGERDSKIISDGIGSLEEGLNTAEDELQAIAGAIGESIEQSGDIADNSSTIGERSQRIEDYSRQLEDGYTDIEEGINGARSIIEEILEED